MRRIRSRRVDLRNIEAKELDTAPDGSMEKTAVLLMRQDPRWEDGPERLAELKGLAEAAGYRVLAEVTQQRGRDRRFQIGRGKIEEAVAKRPHRLIFYNPLSPGQLFNLGKEFNVPAMDRFNLILEIFASRAANREAKLQVELARLTYKAPFVRTMMSLQKLSERPGFMGSGAYDESMYRDIKGRISKISSALRDVEETGESRRRRRRDLGFDLVALAGYTNAGKSTLLNVLTKSKIEAKDQLFTTLSPTTRALYLGGRKAVVTDTVGFIDDLPHFMIKAFRSTLSEISSADLVLLVADLSDPADVLRRKLVASHGTLWECNTTAPIITVLNKADRVSVEEAAFRLEYVKDLAPTPLTISARDGSGLCDLVKAIRDRLGPLREQELSLPYTSEGMRELSRLYDQAELLYVSYGEEMVVRFRGRDGLAKAQKEG